MNKIDARKLSNGRLLRSRRKVILLHQNMIPVMEIVKLSGLSWPTVKKVIRLFEDGGKAALKPEQRGYIFGTGQKLSVEQEANILDIMCRKRPWQVGIKPSCRDHKLYLWNRDSVKQLVEQTCGIKLSVRCIAKYHVRWGFPLLNKLQQPYELCTKEVQAWLVENYTILAHRAKAEGIDIFWIRNKTIMYFEKPQTDEETKIQKMLSMISAVDNRGRILWLLFKGLLTPERQALFLNAIAREFRRKTFLIFDDSKFYNHFQVCDAISRSRGKIELFPPITLRRYSNSIDY